MANHGPFCKRIKNDKENILKLTMWKRQRMQNGAFLKSLSIYKLPKVMISNDKHIEHLSIEFLQHYNASYINL